MVQNFVYNILILLSFGLVGMDCNSSKKPNDVLTNPVDPLSPVFTLPVTTIVSAPDPNTAWTSPTATITVKGNTDAVQFSYILDGSAWSAWTTATTFTLTDLDEGTHTFKVRAVHRDLTTIEQNPPSITFTVHAVTGPALMFGTRKLTVTNGNTFTCYVVAREVQNLYGVRFVFTYDPSAIKLQSISNGTISNNTVQMLSKLSAGDVAMPNCSLRAMVRFKALAVQNTIVAINFTAIKTGTNNLTFFSDSVQFRTPSNTPITINQIVNGKIVIQ